MTARRDLPDGMVPALPDDALADLAADGPDGPLATAAAFYYAARHPDDETRAFLSRIVTPESAGEWGDFTAAGEMLTGTAMLSRPDLPAPGMAYAVFVSDPGQFARLPEEPTAIPVRAWMTLLWDAGREPQWRVHGLGYPVLPEDLPYRGADDG